VPAYPRLSRRLQERLLARAGRRPSVDAAVEYPDWYLVHSHFLPGGYLSTFGGAAYEWLIRSMYSLFQPGRVDRKLARLVARRHPQGRVLDVGCGGGQLVRALVAAGEELDVTGVDLSPVLLDRAAQRLRAKENVRLVHGRGDALPFDNETFDGVTLVHVLGHLPADVARDVLLEAGRVLRGNGRAYLIEHRWHQLPFDGFQVELTQSVRGLPLALVVLRKVG
jgi:SAM-dependent methyltransferase